MYVFKCIVCVISNSFLNGFFLVMRYCMCVSTCAYVCGYISVSLIVYVNLKTEILIV